ncbi:MAG: hypothetical protein R3C53_13275 [Pirellulaceae bacterium]
MQQKISLSAVVLVTPLLLAVGLAWQGLSMLAVIGITQLAILAFSVHLLSRNLPRKLRLIAESNCFRLNESRSTRRTHIESRAIRKLQTDIGGSLLVVLLGGNGFALAIHHFVIPIPLAANAISSFHVDRQAWKEEIQRQRIDDQYKSAYQQNLRGSPQEADQAANQLWRSWPAVALAGILAAMAAQAYLVGMYRRSLAAYARGLAFRAEEYAQCDISRLQHELELEAAAYPSSRSGVSGATNG